MIEKINALKGMSFGPDMICIASADRFDSDDAIFKIVPFNIADELVGVTYIYYKCDSEHIDIYDSYIDDILIYETVVDRGALL